VKELTLVAEQGTFRLRDQPIEFHTVIINLSNGRMRFSIDQTYKKSRLTEIKVTGQSIFIDGAPVPNEITLHPHFDGSVDIIAQMPMEEYLRGVVPSEMYARWPIEALKAQAVAARSYAYRRMLARQSLPYDVEGGVADQQFKFLLNRSSKNVDGALKDTKDLVLYDEKSHVYEALYHADCGGMTEDAVNVWGGTAAARHADCPHPSRKWETDLARKSLVEQFITYFRLSKHAGLKSLQAVGRSQAGRVKEIRVDFTEGAPRTISSQEFRKIVGYDRVPSSNFQLNWLGPQLKIAGLGQGHGVGLCQLGAKAMASAGKTAEEILKFYYPKTRLEKLQTLSMSKALSAE
jgi:stage II sporulation protein D